MEEIEEEDFSPIGSREALPLHGASLKRTYEYCAESAPKAPTRTDGEPAAKWIVCVRARREIVVQEGDHFFLTADEVAYMNRDCGAPPK